MAVGGPSQSASASKDTQQKNICMQCHTELTSTIIYGWKLRNGDSAELCPSCGIFYQKGNFCETFHTKADGWRNCATCGKVLHCGCIVSEENVHLLDHGGVCCNDCAEDLLI